MPNKPKTPARTFRLDDETMENLDAIQEAVGASSRSDAVRQAIDAFTTMGKIMNEHATSTAGVLQRFAENLTDGIPAGIPIEALAAADEAAWLDVHMPRGEADRRLVKALVAAKPYLEAEARRDERQRTLRDVISRLEGIDGRDSFAVAHLKSILED